MQQLVYALNDIKRDFNVLLQKLSAVDRVIKTGDVSYLMRPIQGGQRKRNRKGRQNQQFTAPQTFGQQQTSSVSGLWGASGGGGVVGNTGGRRRNRKVNRQQNVFGGQGFQQNSGGIPPHIAQQAQLTAQYIGQMLKNGQSLGT